MARRDYADAKFWAISGIGYGKGFDVAEAVKNHDETQARNYGSMLSVPVEEIPLQVWEAPDWADGFWSDGSLHWKSDDRNENANGKEQIRAVRLPDKGWLRWAEKEGLDYQTL